MESGDFLIGKNGNLPSFLPTQRKRSTMFRKRRTNYQAIEVEDPYKKLEALICMTEIRLNNLRMSMEKNERKKIKIQKERLQPQHRNEGNEGNNNNNNNQDVWKWEGPPPEWIVKRLENYGGEDLKYFFRKVLTISDVEGQQNRLLPTRKDMRQVVIPYLTAEERNRLEEDALQVMVIDERGTEYKKMVMRFYRSLRAHRIIGPDWSSFVKNNRLESHRHVVYVWGFRVEGKLWLTFDYATTHV